MLDALSDACSSRVATSETSLYKDTSSESTDSVADLKLSRAQLKIAINKGAAWLTKGEGKRKSTQRIRRLKKPLKSGEILHFYYDEAVLSQTCESAKLIADYGDYSIWYKPYGMLSQGSKWSDHLTITRFAQEYFQQQRACFIVHRLDRAATGLILIAHAKKSAAALSKMFETHALTKIYRIISHGLYDFGDDYQVELPVDDKPATSIFSPVAHDTENLLSELTVEIKSGRKHQIRKHATALGFPVVGDRLHGDQQQRYPESLNLQLCAAKLVFECPIHGESREIELDEKLLPQLSAVKEKLRSELVD